MIVVAQSQSDVRLFATPWTAACQASLSLTVFRVCSNLSKFAPLSWWCHPTISSSVIPFSSCLHSFPASGSFPISQLFASGGQSIGASASASVLPMNIQGQFPLELTGLILQFKGNLGSPLKWSGPKITHGCAISRHWWMLSKRILCSDGNALPCTVQ